MRIVVRADSSKTMGFGHITRSLTLARALQDAGADVVSVGQGMREGVAISSSFQNLQIIERAQSHDADEAEQLLALHPDGVVTDGYHFSRNFFELLDEASIPYAIIDDNGETEATNPVVVHNQNPNANREHYGSGTNEPIFLFGLEYALIRPEIFALATKLPKNSGQIVISFGGTDSENLTVPIVEALVEAGHRVAVNERFKVDLSISIDHAERSRAIEFFPSSLFLESLASADLAVVGAGTSLWEANALGTATVGVIVAENQLNPALTGFSEGYVDVVINSLGAGSMESTVSEVVAAADQLRETSARQSTKRVGTDGAKLVAQALLAEFSKHSKNAR